MQIVYSYFWHLVSAQQKLAFINITYAADTEIGICYA